MLRQIGRLFIALFSFFVYSTAYSDHSLVQKTELKLLNWEAYLSADVIAGFEAETGINIQEFRFSNETERDALTLGTRSHEFDLVMYDNTRLLAKNAHQLFQPMTDIKQQHRHAISPRWQKACGDYGVAYSWGTVGIAYRSSMTDSPVHSWKQFFNPEKAFQGTLAVTPGVTDLPAAALLSLGADPTSSDQADLRNAYQVLEQQAPHVLTYEYGLSYAIKHKTHSQMAMTMVYSADVEEIISNTEQTDWVYVVPDEGTMLWIDCWSAPAGKPFSGAARIFLNYINRPDIAALNAEQAWFSTPIPEARNLASKTYRNDHELFPPPAIEARSHSYRPRSPERDALVMKMIHHLKRDRSAKE